MYDGKKMSKNNDISKSNIQKDKPNEVADFFNRWHKETKAYCQIHNLHS